MSEVLFGDSGECDIRQTIRGFEPRIPFKRIKERVLGGEYSLSVVLIGDSLAKKLNTEHRNKKYPTNVLSFPISSYEGEIFINVRKAEREARMLQISANKRITHLFIHGCLHLKGLAHGDIMDAQEERFLKEFTSSSKTKK